MQQDSNVGYNISAMKESCFLDLGGNDMSEKRRDNKGRILRQGESQRKDGKYEYKYRDLNGERRSIYSWRLVENDKIPAGKKKTRSLRELEKEIQKSLLDGTQYKTDVTFNDLFELYMMLKSGLRPQTIAQKEILYKKHLEKPFGNVKIENIKYSTMSSFFSKMLSDGYAISFIQNVYVIANGCCKIALRDGLIQYNPCTSIISELKTKSNRPQPRNPLTVDEQNTFLGFAKQHKKYWRYYPLFVFLLGTGCRIGEALAVTWEDCDFENETISISKSVSFFTFRGESKFRIGKPKTQQGIREIPMIPSVKRALILERKNQFKRGKRSTATIDGYSNFVFISNVGNPYVSKDINKICRDIVNEYNEIELQKATNDNRIPVLLPRITPHIFRHTYCTTLCEKQIDVKVIQSVMGHVDIQTTLNVYTKVTDNMKQTSFDKIRQIQIG